MLQSFDLFDTLIARRCISPVRLYEAVEQQTKIDGLAQARMKAGHQFWISQAPHSTQDIYKVALSYLHITSIEPLHLAHLEYEHEYHECMPVLRAFMQINRKSVVISDMHHPMWVIERIYTTAAQSIGSRWLPSFLLSNQDKHTGTVWRNLAIKGCYVQHLGDNKTSDLDQPLAYGHRATIFNWTELQSHEKKLIACGLESIARAVRSVRLQCMPLDITLGANLFRTMCVYVIPVLAIASLLLREVMQKTGKNDVVFVGRDGAVWHTIFTSIFKHIPTRRIALSRRLMRDSPDTALAMLKSCVSDQTLLADLAGSGSSWSKLVEDTGLTKLPPICHLIQYPSWRETSSLNLHSLVDFSKISAHGIHALEAMCEESYSNITSAEWINTDSANGFVKLNTLLDDDLCTTQPTLVERLQQIVCCSSRELQAEILRSGDQAKTQDVRTLLHEFIYLLNQQFEVIDYSLNFTARNAKSA
jgi:hypothetical protein